LTLACEGFLFCDKTTPLSLRLRNPGGPFGLDSIFLNIMAANFRYKFSRSSHTVLPTKAITLFYSVEFACYVKDKPTGAQQDEQDTGSEIQHSG
jgi:hypothetical protein